MRITVIGTGYLGAVHAAAMARIGHEVVAVDVDRARIALLAEGRAPFFEPGFPELLAEALASGRLRFTTSFRAAADHGDLHFLCVGTPQRADSPAADLGHVEAAVRSLARELTRDCLVVGKSTVPVGTSGALDDLLERTAPPGRAARVAWNPEFLREGYAVQDTLEPDRIVVGVREPADADLIAEVYRPMLERGTPYLVTDRSTAELVKVAANAFLATKISFINAMAEVCEAAGGDVVTLADAIGHDARIGRRFLGAGIGFGGGCLPKDIRAFAARAGELGVGDALGFLEQVEAINLRRRERAVEAARVAVGGELTGRRVAVLGAAFKPDSDDVRDSPALDVARRLHRAGAVVRVHDPEALERARAAAPELDYTDSLEKAVEGSDVVLHLTEWADYRRADPAALRPLSTGGHLVDGRNALDAVRWRAAGWTVTALGRGRGAIPPEAP